MTTPNQHPDLYAAPSEYARRKSKYKDRDLWVLQRPFKDNWAIQARIALHARIGLTPRPDPALVLAELVRETVSDNNFGLTPDTVATIKDPEFGYFLCEWLGVYELIRTWTAAEAKASPKGSAPSSKGRHGTPKSRSG